MEAELAKADSAQSWLRGMQLRVQAVDGAGPDRDNASAVTILVQT
jgi:hypothetical protein